MFFQKTKKIIFNRGVTMFIAVVVMGLLLLISSAVLNIALKGKIFASYGRDSQYAFYAAESGIECAVYWDSKFEPSKFSTSTVGTISCGGQVGITTDSQTVPTSPSQLSRVGGGGDLNPTSIFYFDLNQGSNPLPYCAIVSVTKNSDGTTYIKSRGYNTCNTSANRVERGIEVMY